MRVPQLSSLGSVTSPLLIHHRNFFVSGMFMRSASLPHTPSRTPQTVPTFPPKVPPLHCVGLTATLLHGTAALVALGKSLHLPIRGNCVVHVHRLYPESPYAIHRGPSTCGLRNTVVDSWKFVQLLRWEVDGLVAFTAASSDEVSCHFFFPFKNIFLSSSN